MNLVLVFYKFIILPAKTVRSNIWQSLQFYYQCQCFNTINTAIYTGNAQTIPSNIGLDCAVFYVPANTV